MRWRWYEYGYCAGYRVRVQPYEYGMMVCYALCPLHKLFTTMDRIRITLRPIPKSKSAMEPFYNCDNARDCIAFFFFFSRSKIPARNIMHTVPRVPELCIATIVIDEKPRAHFPGPSKLQFAQKGTRYGATATTANRIRRYGAPQPKLKFFHLVTKSAEIILRAAIHWVRNSSVVIVHWGQRDKRRIRFTPDRRILDPLLVKVRAAYRSSLFGY